MRNWLLIILIGGLLSGCDDSVSVITATNDTLIGDWKCRISFYSNWEDGVLHSDYIYLTENEMNILEKEENGSFFTKVNNSGWSQGGLFDYWNINNNRANTSNDRALPVKTIKQLSADKFIYTEEKINASNIKTKIEISCGRFKY